MNLPPPLPLLLLLLLTALSAIGISCPVQLLSRTLRPDYHFRNRSATRNLSATRRGAAC